ncbi:MAG: putative hemolysin activation/secretion protein [Rhizobacter sp.]|nr:putative hemolysin activation/secretion protein [Rhizobacter sp.]
MADHFQFALLAIAPWPEPRCLDRDGLNQLMTQAQAAIVDQGFSTTRVLAEPQALSSGEFVMTVIPGRIGAVVMDDGGSGRATVWNALTLGPGDLLNVYDIEQSLDNLKRVPSVEADIRIAVSRASPEPGFSDLQVGWKQAFPFRVNLSLDDAGSPSTGKYQGSATVSYDNALTLNDLFYLTVSHQLDGVASNGVDGEKKATQGSVVHYSLPFGDWLVGATASRNGYRQTVAGAYQDYVYSGETNNADLRVARLVHRDSSGKTSVWARGWLRSSNNFIDDTEVEVQRRRMAGWEVGIDHRQYAGDRTLDLHLAAKRGTGALHATAAPEEAFGEGTSRLGLVTADLQVVVPFTIEPFKLRWSTSARAQWNATPLVPQDRFSIGNRYTVRGFDGESTLSAERGWYVRNEIGTPLAATGAEVYLGVDTGAVAGPSVAALVGRRLAGAVVGARGSWQGVSCDMFVGRPISKPEGFRTAGATLGFNASWSF